MSKVFSPSSIYGLYIHASINLFLLVHIFLGWYNKNVLAGQLKIWNKIILKIVKIKLANYILNDKKREKYTIKIISQNSSDTN